MSFYPGQDFCFFFMSKIVAVKEGPTGVWEMCSRILFFSLLEQQLLAFLFFFSLNQDYVFNFLDCCSNRVGIRRRRSTECILSAERAWSFVCLSFQTFPFILWVCKEIHMLQRRVEEICQENGCLSRKHELTFRISVWSWGPCLGHGWNKSVFVHREVVSSHFWLVRAPSKLTESWEVFIPLMRNINQWILQNRERHVLLDHLDFIS